MLMKLFMCRWLINHEHSLCRDIKFTSWPRLFPHVHRAKIGGSPPQRRRRWPSLSDHHCQTDVAQAFQRYTQTARAL